MGKQQFNVIAASKKMNRLRLHIINDAFDINVLWCRVTYAPYESWDYSSHRHSFFELHFIMDGSCMLVTDGRYAITLTRHAFLLVPPQTPHQLSSVSGNLAKFVIAFRIQTNAEHTDGLLAKQAMESINVAATYDGTKRMHQYVDDILESAYCQHQALSSIATAYFTLFFLEAFRQIVPQYKSGKQLTKSAQSNACIQAVHSFIIDHITEGINSEQVAEQVNMSEKQLNRILKANLDITISKLIEEEKINHLRALLMTNLTLAQIAEQAGFSNEYNMNRFFKRLEGMSPGRYRKAFVK